MALTAAERQKRRRERFKAGLTVVPVEIDSFLLTEFFARQEAAEGTRGRRSAPHW
jgi:hypothetical protein